MSIEGKIVSVLMSPNHGYPTYPQDSVNVLPMGIEGDAHYGPMRESFTAPGTYKPNDRPISIVSHEVLQEINSKLGLQMKPGDFNEQVLVEGLGDLGWITIGSLITFIDSAVQLEVVDYAYPCKKLADYNGDMRLLSFLVDTKVRNSQGKPYSKRGILAQVRTTGELHPGCTVRILPPTHQK